MDREFLDLELVEDREIVAAVAEQMSSAGGLLVCSGCGDVEALIVGFLVLEHDEKAWALCGSCFQKLPSRAAVT